ncbi:MAG: hypothetical protein HWD59_02530 [Coxiellaceae bacterium]|nr:MAG: hypothetical protein HWD59_02530 [Coxiellaceae bacterium]
MGQTKDQQANKNNEQKIVKRDFGYIISPHSLIGGLIVFVLIGFYFIAPHIVSEIFKTMKNFLGEEAFLPTLAVGALTMGIIRGAWGRSRYEAQQDQIEVKTFRKEQQDAEEQIRSCLENLYKLRIVEYVNDTNTNNNAGPAIAIKIAANYLDWKTNAEQDKITRPKRDKKSVREISAKQPPAEASVKQQPTKDIYTNEYTYTTTQVIRKFIYHQTKYNFSLERKH